jgi:hypothetical protein
MKFRKLRIAWSVGCGILAVLLAVLWMRSYVYSDRVSGPVSKTKGLLVASLAGAVQCRLDDNRQSPKSIAFRPWQIGTDSVAEFQKAADELHEMQVKLGSTQAKPTVDFTMKIGLSGKTLFLPYWLLTGLPLCLTVVPWGLRLKRCSLRTLLIATTLVAVILGLVVYAAS